MIIIIHHLQSCWDDPLIRQIGKDSIQIGREIAQAIRAKKRTKKSSPSMVVLTQFEEWKPASEHYLSGIADLVTDWHEYGYGWEKESMNHGDVWGVDWCIGKTHSEVVWIPQWLWDIKNSREEVLLCGVFDGECIQDMEVALSHCDIPYKRWERFIV